MDKTNYSLVQDATNISEAVSQFVAVAKDQGDTLYQAVSQAVIQISDERELLDELIWQFKVHAPQGLDLNAATGSPLQRDYHYVNWVSTH